MPQILRRVAGMVAFVLLMSFMYFALSVGDREINGVSWWLVLVWALVGYLVSLAAERGECRQVGTDPRPMVARSPHCGRRCCGGGPQRACDRRHQSLESRARGPLGRSVHVVYHRVAKNREHARRTLA